MDNIIKNIPIENIILNQNIPVDKKELNTLSQSIKKYGIVEPLLVRQNGDKYEIISGRKRYLVAKNIGLKEVPVLVRNIEKDFYNENNEQTKDISHNKFINPFPKTNDNLPKKNKEKKKENITNENIIENDINSIRKEYNNNSDIINLSELDKKENERDEFIMNNQEMNNIGVQPQNVNAPQGQAPTFGGRFFPSLEDEPTNMDIGEINAAGNTMQNTETNIIPTPSNELIDLTDDTNEKTPEPQQFNNQQPIGIVNPLENTNVAAPTNNQALGIPQNEFNNNMNQNYQEQPNYAVNTEYPTPDKEVVMEQSTVENPVLTEMQPENNNNNQPLDNQMNINPANNEQQNFSANQNMVEQSLMEPQFDMSQSMITPQNNMNQEWNQQEQIVNNYNEIPQQMNNIPVYNNQPEMIYPTQTNNNIPNLENQMPLQQEMQPQQAGQNFNQPVQQDFIQPELPTNDIQQFPQKDVGPVVNTIKNLVNSLKEFGYEINISENDLGSSTQITIDVQK